jgi:hypothetical protein
MFLSWIKKKLDEQDQKKTIYRQKKIDKENLERQLSKKELDTLHKNTFEKLEPEKKEFDKDKIIKGYSEMFAFKRKVTKAEVKREFHNPFDNYVITVGQDVVVHSTRK